MSPSNAFSDTRGGELRDLASPEPAAVQEPAGSDEAFAPGIAAAFPDSFQESSRRAEIVQGEVPKFVRGTYFVNGPAQFGIGGIRYRHWLDGDGMVCALHFQERDEIRLTSRYVRSTKFVTEQQSGRPIFRAFGTAFPGDRLNRVNNGLESPVNVSVYPFGDQLLAFGEQGLPWALDPLTLETRAEFTFNRRLNHASPFSAHPKFDADSQEMFNFGVFFSLQTPKLYIYCFDQEGLRYRRSVPLDHPCSIHDFSLSKHYAIFYLSPYILNVQGLLQHGQPVLDALDWQPERGSRLLIVDRSSGNVAASLPVGPRYCLHLMNSFEEDGFLTVDTLEFDSPIYPEYQPIPELFRNVSKGGPVRFVIDLRRREIVERNRLNDLFAPDFPAIDPRRAMRPYDDFWMLGISSAVKRGSKFFDQLIHGQWSDGSMDVYCCDSMCYLGGEPVIISAPDSDESVVLCEQFNARERTSYFLIFDARNVSGGPIARIGASQILPLGFHAVFQASQASAR